MNRGEFFEWVKRLRAEGKSIRAIAEELGVHRSRVARALKSVAYILAEEPTLAAAPASCPVRLGQGVFVGRQREKSELKAALEDAAAGRGRLVMLAGEPGIGKTRTCQELAACAAPKGCRVLWGRCYEEPGVPPYWPWVQVIRSYVQQRTTQIVRSEMGAGAADRAIASHGDNTLMR